MSLAGIFSSRRVSTEVDSNVSIVEYPHIYVERTLALIKPDAMEKANEIEDIILTSGFQIAQVSNIVYNFGRNMESNKNLPVSLENLLFCVNVFRYQRLMAVKAN